MSGNLFWKNLGSSFGTVSRLDTESEVFAGVFDSFGNIVTSDWKRGSSSSELPWNYNQLALNVSGDYYLCLGH